MQFFKRLFNAKRDDAINASEILPVLRTVAPGAGAPVEIPEEDQPVVQPLAADILVCYAVETPEMFRFISPRDCALLGIEPSGLKKLSMTNLERLAPRLGISPANAPFFRIADAHGHESAVLLAKSVWDSMSLMIQGNIIAIVPGRDVLIFTGTGTPDGPARLRAMVEELYPQMTTPLSRRLLLRRENKWTDYDSPA